MRHVVSKSSQHQVETARDAIFKRVRADVDVPYGLGAGKHASRRIRSLSAQVAVQHLCTVERKADGLADAGRKRWQEWRWWEGR